MTFVNQQFSLLIYLQEFIQPFLVLGWLLVLFLILWVAWQVYMLIKTIEYISAIEWTHLQITLPDTAEETPAAMEHAYNVWGGIHKNPDIIEKFFDGYVYAWYSCEIHCQPNRARYIMVVPTVHRKFFEGVIYGQYPAAEINEVADYTLRYKWEEIGETFDLYGTEMILTQDDIYPIKTYREYEDTLAPEDRFIDPHQSLIEAYTNIADGEEFWMQVLVRPSDQKVPDWFKKGEEEIAKISGQPKKETPSMMGQFIGFFTTLPKELLQAFANGPLEPEDAKEDKQALKFFNPAEEAKMKGILLKISKGAFQVKIRVIYIAPKGKMNKPAIGKAIGAFKQFNAFNLNSFKPDPDTKTNGPNLVAKKTRRALRMRKILLNFQWRDFWGENSGQMFNGEELATLYHFPVRFMKSPSIERAKSGLRGAPENLPYA